MRTFVMFVLVLLFAGTGRADQVMFENGDHLSGSVVSLGGGKLEFDSAVLGKTSINLSKVRTLSTEAPIQIHMSDGTVVVDSVSQADPGAVRTAGGSTFGTRSLLLSEIVAINPPDPEIWSGRFVAGATIERGNSNTESANVEAKTQRRDEDTRISLAAGYRGERQEDKSAKTSNTTTRSIYGSVKYDYFLSEKLYWYASSQAEKDGVANLSLRLVTGGGVGYQIWERDDLAGFIEGGLTWVSENYSGNTSDEDYLAARVGWNFAKRLADSVRFFHEGRWVPSLEDVDDHLIDTETGIRSDLGSSFFLETKVRWTWDSTPAKDKERQDVTYILGLGYEF